MAESGVPRSLWLVPLLTVIVLGVSLFSQQESDHFHFVRVFGGPTSERFCGRLQLLEEQSNLERAAPGTPLRIGWTRARQRSVRQVRTDREGWADFCFPAPDRPSTQPGILQVELAGHMDPLVDAPLALAKDRWLRAVSHRQPPALVELASDYPLEVQLSPPVLSVPFYGTLRLRTRSPKGLDLLVEAEGLELPDVVPTSIGPEATLTLRVVATGHTASLSLRSRTPGEEAWNVTTFDIPVVPGSLTFLPDPASPTRGEIASPIVREAAYFAIVGPWGRGPGDRVELTPRADGTASGFVDLGALLHPRELALQDTYLVLSSVADGRTPALVGLPLGDQSATFDARDALLFDGEAPARARSERHVRRVRWILGAYAAVAGVFGVALFWFHFRRATRALERDLSRVGLPVAAQDRSLGLPLLALFSLFFAFSLAVLWIVAR